MSAVLNRDETVDSTAQAEPRVAGLSTKPQYRREQEEAAPDSAPDAEALLARINNASIGAPKPAAAAAADASNEPVIDAGAAPAVAGFGAIDAIEPLAGSPQTEPVTDEAIFKNIQNRFLRMQLAAAWGEDDIDNAAFEPIKHFTVVQPASDTSALVLADPASQDEMQVGTRADGVQAVLGNDNITAAQALSRAQVAMTSTRFRTEGIDQIHGTEKDKALLMLAARKVGLTISNPPAISAEIMAEAQQEWDAMLTAREAAPVAPAAAVPAAGNGADFELDEASTPGASIIEELQPSSKDVDIDLSEPAAAESTIEVLAATPAAVSETPADMINELTAATEPDPVFTKISVESPEVQDFLKDVTVTEIPEGDPAFADTITSLPADGIPILTDVIEEGIKPQALTVLGDESKLSKAAYLDLREQIKQGNQSLVNSEGFVGFEGLRNHFRTANGNAGSTAATATALRALEAEGIVYKTTDTKVAYRAVVNPHVNSPVMYPPRPSI